MSTLTVKIGELTEMISECLAQQIVPFISGPPAIGKSQIVYQLATNKRLKVIDMRLSQSDPTEMNGFPAYNANNTKASFIPMSTFPIEGDALPVDETGKEMNGWILFLDELTSAPMGVQAAAFKLVLDRMVGEYSLHKNVWIIAAGNRMEDKGITHRLSTPMQSRLAHFEAEIDPEGWLKWAAKSGIDHRIRSYIAFTKEALYDFEPNHKNHTFASPRTWEFCSKLIAKYPNKIPDNKMALLASVVDEAAAMSFHTYSEIFPSLISYHDIMADPTGVRVPEEPSVIFALVGSLSEKTDQTNVVNLLKFIERTGIEHQIHYYQQAVQRDMSLLNVKAIDNWMLNYSKDMF